MRVRVGNIYEDQHKFVNPNWSSHVYEFITWPDRPPHQVIQAIEWALDNADQKFAVFVRGTKMPERIHDRERINTEVPEDHKDYGTHWFGAVVNMQDGDPDKQGWANGVVYTSWQQEEREAEPCLHVAITMYDQGCANYRDCIAGHKGAIMQQAPVLNLGQMLAIEEEIGVHDKYYLGVNPKQDIDILSGLGWTPLDPPCRGSKEYTLGHLYKALDYVALSRPGDYEGLIINLHNAGYVLDTSIVSHIAQTRKLDTQVKQPSTLEQMLIARPQRRTIQLSRS